MTKITLATLQFLKDIKENNDKGWFEKNKTRYQKANQELKTFGEELLCAVMSFDESLRDETKPYVFRIYRDARFAKGRPYKNNLGLMLGKGGRTAMHERAGYYLHIEPGGCFLAGGAYMPPTHWLGAIRENIAEEPEEIKRVIESDSFKRHFKLEGEKLKTAPRNYPKDHPEIELLRHKHFLAMHYLTDKEVVSGHFLEHLVKLCKALHPFDEYLNRFIY